LVPGYPLYVRTPKGKLINLIASPKETVGSLKSRLAFWEGVPVNQRLMFNGQIMDDNCTSKHYNVPKGGVVHLNPDNMSMYIRKPDGNTELVNPHPHPHPHLHPHPNPNPNPNPKPEPEP
jgi:hypothetical protein